MRHALGACGMPSRVIAIKLVVGGGRWSSSTRVGLLYTRCLSIATWVKNWRFTYLTKPSAPFQSCLVGFSILHPYRWRSYVKGVQLVLSCGRR